MMQFHTKFFFTESPLIAAVSNQTGTDWWFKNVILKFLATSKKYTTNDLSSFRFDEKISYLYTWFYYSESPGLGWRT